MADWRFTHKWLPGTSRRTLLLLHGTGGNEEDLVPLGQSIAPEANLLSPRGRIDENGMNRWFRRFGEGQFDLENMREETDALAEFLSDARKAYSIDLENTFAVGFSNGANIAASLLLRRPELLAGAFLMRAMVPFEPEESPALAGTHVLLSSGETDPMVPRDNAERLATLFVRGGADVEHLWLPVGHNLTKQELQRAREWLDAL